MPAFAGRDDSHQRALTRTAPASRLQNRFVRIEVVRSNVNGQTDASASHLAKAAAGASASRRPLGSGDGDRLPSSYSIQNRRTWGTRFVSVFRRTVSNPPSLERQRRHHQRKSQAIRVVCTGLDPAHLKRPGGGANNIGHSGFIPRRRVVFGEVRCDLQFFLGVQQQLRSLQAVRSIRHFLRPK